ncbi:hypothetical protein YASMINEVIRUS_30 [Yasminevirus sp. GU-2018]|uniref:Phosphomevalonate kinase n=1 Tax=Yasminevirus sp. GU-2018 TaxID=2420051 RepID=A0A5K0U6K8_9VIRU|nr:hypothetical protein YASMINEVIRUS_30 [Yasminevirus sp. GU-2018]
MNNDKSRLILMISGKRTCGKDTVAKIIVDYLTSLAEIIPKTAFKLGFNVEDNINKMVEVMSFAKALKKTFCSDLGYDFDRMMNDYDYKEEHRADMTNYFMKMRYIEGEDYFSNILIDDILSKHKYDSRIVIVSDLRLKGDLERFRELERGLLEKELEGDSERCSYKVVVIRVNSTEESKSKRGWHKKRCDSDFTETDLDDCTDFDFVIDNDGTLEELKNKVLDTLMKI